ncbi:Uncharacterized protein APZ42_015599 [Daphnia magna]|uniref:Chitin-binding type-4 domain-containing protein n=1 Tax=Daphnia magna TaxID=35525 RepID=A0A162NU36_9CRUS|nr:Uncharacterized protein APZ42_015599 [Daphnia magna]
MEQLNATNHSSTVVNSEQFTLTAVSVMNLLAQLEWRAIALAILASILVTLVDGHGRLFDPPSRSTAWRVGFDTPKDYNRQWLVNSGRCGVCGDPYDEVIKPHEAPGGLFATGTIVRNYTQGQIIPVTIQITATHRGFYEFKLCPNNNPKKDPTQDCFERYPLNFVDETGATDPTFNMEKLSPATYQVQIQLPPEVTCSQCIIQWTYVTGNRWGVCPDGSSRLGCGPQESFRACSDVAIAPFGE